MVRKMPLPSENYNVILFKTFDDNPVDFEIGKD
jgi:hypothetical protein